MRFAKLPEALQTNLIFFDYGQVLGTQIEDAFDETTHRLLECSGLTQESLETRGQWDSFQEGLRLLVIPPGGVPAQIDDNPEVFAKLQRLPNEIRVISRLDLHRHSQLFGSWIESINAYLRVYGGVRPVSRGRFENAYFGPLTPNPWIQETLGDLLQLKTGLNIRFGVISNFEAAGKPWMVKFLRKHYHSLIDEELIVITGEEGVAKGDGPQVFERALQTFRRRYGEPACPVFVDNQVHQYVENAGQAGIRAFVHYGFAGAESKAQGGFYGREFEEAGLYPSVDGESSLFRALVQKSRSRSGSSPG